MVIKVLLIEDDLYSSSMIWSLLARDWRTEVVGEPIYTRRRAFEVLARLETNPDVIILDTERAASSNTSTKIDSDWATSIVEAVRKKNASTRIVCLCTKPQQEFLRRIASDRLFSAYLVKNEIGFAIATAVCLAASGAWVLTRSSYDLLFRPHMSIPTGLLTIVQSRTDVFESLSGREKQIANLFILFNHAHRDIADELNISENESRQIARKLYSRLEKQGLLANLDNIRAIEHDPIMSEKIKTLKITNPFLAFYILTEPNIEVIE